MWHFNTICRTAAVLALACAGSARAGESSSQLRIGYFSLPPHSGRPEERAEQAPVVEYARRVGREMGALDVNVAVYPLPRLIRMLESGELDMAMMLAKSPSRASTLVYSSQPVYVAKPVLVLAATNPLRRVERADDMLGVRIGTWSASYLSPVLRDARLVTQRIGGDAVAERHLRMLSAGHIDAFYSPDQCTVSYALRNVQASPNVRQLVMPDRETPLYAVFSRVGARRWSAPYEAAFTQLQGRAGYSRLLGHRCVDAPAFAEFEAGDEIRVRGAILSLSAGLAAE